jgi:ABC-2 type transport system permease protein
VNLRRTLAISRRIAEQFRRDRRTLGLLFVAPLVILALLGWVIRDQSPTTTRLAVANEVGPAAEGIAGSLIGAAQNGGLSVVAVADEAAARAALTADEIDVAIVLPADMLPGQRPTLRILTQGVAPTEDVARLSELQQIIGDASGQPGPIIEHQSIYGAADADFLDAFAPALVGFLVFFLVFVLTGISFLRERVGGTLERLLATPVRRSEIVVGYSVGFSLFATLQVALILAFALSSIEVPAIGPFSAFSVGLGVSSVGSPLLAFLVTLLLALAAVNLGIFLSTFARSELQILQFIPIVIVPQGLLDGVFWPVETLPGPLEPIARLLPMTYGIDGLREVLVKGSDLSAGALQLDLAVLAALALLLAALAMATIRREVA